MHVFVADFIKESSCSNEFWDSHKGTQPESTLLRENVLFGNTLSIHINWENVLVLKKKQLLVWLFYRGEEQVRYDFLGSYIYSWIVND